MEIVDYLEPEQVIIEINDNLDRYAYTLDLADIRQVIKTADELGIKFYRKLEEL